MKTYSEIAKILLLVIPCSHDGGMRFIRREEDFGVLIYQIS